MSGQATRVSLRSEQGLARPRMNYVMPSATLPDGGVPMSWPNGGQVVLWCLGLAAAGIIVRLGWEIGGKLWMAF